MRSLKFSVSWMTQPTWTDIDHLEENAAPQKLDEIAPAVNKVLAALASLEAFTEALGEDGLFAGSRGGIKDEDIEGIFDAVPAQWTVTFGKSDNTRYGVYSKTERADGLATNDLEASAEEDDMPSRYGAFAYSPHKASSVGDLPSSGEAYYEGETIAQEQSEFTIYKGTIELQIQFRSKRVKGLVSDLMDGDGKSYSTSNGAVDSIILPDATMDNDAKWIEGGDDTNNATVIHVPVPGGAGSDEMDGDFKGQIVGEGENAGAAVIGTWALMADRNMPTDKGNLVGSYGAERAPPRPVSPPEFEDDSEKSETSLATDSPVNDEGMIAVGDDPTSDDADKMIEVAAADLYADGDETVMGTNFVEAAKTAIEKELDRLDAFIALDDANGDDPSATANEGREGVWDAIDNNTSGSEGALQMIFGTEYDHDGDDTNTAQAVRILSENDPEPTEDSVSPIIQYPVNKAGDAPDDVTAKDELNTILAALGSLEAFEEATKKGGDLDSDATTSDDEDGLLDGKKAEDVFNRVPYTVNVRYGHTDYTRFGAWFRTSSATAADDLTFVAANTGHFAYSPMKQTPGDEYPDGGSAVYEGRTIARDTFTDDDDQTVPKFYHGDIQVQVSWDADTVTNSDVTAIVSNLMDADGGMYADPGAEPEQGDNDKVMMIILEGSVTDTGDVLGVSGTDTRVRYEGFGVSGRSATGTTLTGKFVGESLDGPRAIIGSWSLNSNLSGVYGADIQP